jgi:proteasome lid subunit RPN8/RPN11/archaellum component FlaC
LSTGDDIVFGEMTYREPMRLRRPDRDGRRTCIAYQIPAPGELPIFLERRPADAIERHALRDTSVELGGILLGKECVDDETGEPFVLITEALEAKHYENTQASFTYTHDSWEEITRERDEKHPDLDIVGWYHTHPDFGVFLSSHDLFIHHHFFAQPLQVAYVVDPIRQTRGFFQWKDGQMQQVRGFHLSADRAERQPLARLVNDLEGIPNADGGGSGLSPRLEAELIAMLTRPHPPATVDRGQTAAVFSMLGVLIGSLAVAGLMWLYMLGNTLRDQSEAVKALAQAQEKTAEEVEKAIKGARTSAKEQALDALLADVGPGETPESVRTKLTESTATIQGLQEKVANLETEKDALASNIRSVKSEYSALSKQVGEIRSKAEEDLKDAGDKLRLSEAKATQLDGMLAERDRLLQDNGVADLERRYNLAFWAAVGGWAAFAFSVVGLFVMMSRSTSAGEMSSSYAVPQSQLQPPSQTTVPRPGSDSGPTYIE